MTKGSITIYLSLVFVSVLLLVSVIIESARMNVVQTESKGFTYLAADSVLAGYVRQIYEDYGILLAWEDKSLKEQLMKYLQANINMADLNIGGTNVMATRLKDISIKKVEYATGEGAKAFVDEVSSYMKYAIATTSVKKLVDLYSESSNSQKKCEASKYMVDVEKEDNSKICELVDDIHQKIENLKEKKVKNKLNTDKKRAWFLESINEIIKKIEVYLKEKEDFQKKHKNLSGNDYMDSNLKILEQIKNKIEEEQLIDSSKTKEEWESIGVEIEKQIKSLIVHTPTEEDEANKSIYQNAKELLEKGILSMVVEDTAKISSTSVTDSNLPSKEENNIKIPDVKLSDKANLILYSGMKFGNYRNIKKKSDLSYELEYIIAGKDNDRSNLTVTVEQMVAARNIITLSYLITDKGKMAELSAVASSATTAIGLPFLEPVIKAVLTEGWALAEAVSDVKTVMSGKKIDLWKNSKNWKSGLKNLFQSHNTGSDKKAAIDYQQFCYLLMMKEDTSTIVARMFDLIQINIKKNYNASFNMNQCFFGFDVEVFYESEPLFVSLPWAIDHLGERIGAYSFSIKYKASY